MAKVKNKHKITRLSIDYVISPEDIFRMTERGHIRIIVEGEGIKETIGNVGMTTFVGYMEDWDSMKEMVGLWLKTMDRKVKERKNDIQR